MSRKVHIVSASGSAVQMEQGFRKLEVPVELHFPRIPFILLTRPFRKYLENIKGYYFNRVLAKTISQLGPDDILLMIKGYYIRKGLEKKLVAAPFKKIALTIDSVDRAPGQLGICRVADLVFLQDKGDMGHPALASKRKFHLPLGYDEHVFFKKNIEKKYDICLVGNFYPDRYRKRYDLIMELGRSAEFRDKKIAVIGGSGNTSLNQDLAREFTHMDFLGKLDGPQLNETFNSSKIVVNIHQDDGLEPVNPWLFMISGAGACQVVDYRPYLENYYQDKKEICMVNFPEIPAFLLKILESPAEIERIANAASNRTMMEHSNMSRAEHMLKVLMDKKEY